jgi:hypothetical protein
MNVGHIERMTKAGPQVVYEADQAEIKIAASDGAEILNRTFRFIGRFVALTEKQARVVTLWTAHTHAVTAADCTPYLDINSPEKQSGKTRLLEVVETLVDKPWLTGRVTAAVLIRKTDAVKPTLLLDESDAAFGAEKEYAEALRGVLNTGYRRGGQASCCIGQGANTDFKDFSTFCPKAIAGIGKLPDTVADRSIPIRLKRARRGIVEKFRRREIDQEASEIKSLLAAWCEANLERLRAARPKIPDTLSDRQADCCEPLLAIAELAGGDWPEAAREAVIGEGQADDSISVKLLLDIKSILEPRDEHKKPLPKVERIASCDLAKSLGEMEERPWVEWGKAQKPITPPQIARLLGKYGISPTTMRLPDERRLKGYQHQDFTEAWELYLPPDSPQSPSTPDSNRDTVTTRDNIEESGVFRSVTPSPCHASENVKTPNKNGLCHGVTVQKSGTGAVDGLFPTSLPDDEAEVRL